MKIYVSTLCENTASFGFLAEFGLGMLVEVDGMKILMDTGTSFTAVHNAQLMGIDLSTVDRIVLSHGHYDHTGGLCNVLKVMKKEVEVIAHPKIWQSKYTMRDEQVGYVYYGFNFSRDEAESLGARFNLTKEPVHISEHIMTTGEIPFTVEYEKFRNRLKYKENGEFKDDQIPDDLAFAIDTELGLVVILGCAHRGLITTLRQAQKVTGKEKVYAAIGGTHLFDATDEKIDKTILDLRDMGVQKLGAGHCTGFHASSRLAQEFGDKFFMLNAGTRLTLP